MNKPPDILLCKLKPSVYMHVSIFYIPSHKVIKSK